MSSFQGGAYTIGTGYNALSDLAPEIRSRAPTSSDTGFPIGKVWVDKVANISYVLTSFSPASNGTQQANWNVSATTGVLDTLTGDSGSAISPVANNIDILGTAAQIETTGSPGTITLSIADPFNIPGDVVIPGTLSVTGLTTLGALTQVGTASINATGAATTTIGSAAAGAISIDTTAGVTINADEASSFTVTDAGVDLTLSSTLGSVNITAGQSAADSIVISSAIGGIDITAAGASAGEDIDITATGSSVNITATENVADSIVISSSNGGIDISAASAAAGEDIDITATGSSINLVSTEAAVANAIRLNASAADGGIDIDAGTGGITIDSTGAFSIDGAAASNVTVTGAGIDLTLASVLGSVLVSSTEDAALAIRLYANAGTSETIQIHSDQGTGVGSINLLSDVGGITLTATGLASADAINLEAPAGGVDIDGALQVNIASSQNAVDAVRILASAGGIDIDAVGAATEDIAITNTGGSITLAATEAVGDAITLTASDAAGGIILTAGTGNVNVAGNLALTSVATKILMNGGAATDFIGTATLTNGTVTVNNTNIATGDVILVTRTAVNASTVLGFPTTSIVNATSFAITARETATPGDTEVGDQSSFAYVIFRPT